MIEPTLVHRLYKELESAAGSADLEGFFTSADFVTWMRGLLTEQGIHAPAELHGSDFWKWLLQHCQRQQ